MVDKRRVAYPSCRMRFPSRFRISLLAVGLLVFACLGGSIAKGEWATTDIDEMSYVELEEFAGAFR